MDIGKEEVQFEWSRIIFGLGIGFLAMLLLTALIAWLIGAGVIGSVWMEELAALILVLSGYLTGLAGRGERGHGLDALAAGGMGSLILAVLSAILFEINLAGWLSVSVAVMGGCGVAVLLRSSRRGRKKWKKYGYR